MFFWISSISWYIILIITFLTLPLIILLDFQQKDILSILTHFYFSSIFIKNIHYNITDSHFVPLALSITPILFSRFFALYKGLLPKILRLGPGKWMIAHLILIAVDEEKLIIFGYSIFTLIDWLLFFKMVYQYRGPKGEISTV